MKTVLIRFGEAMNGTPPDGRVWQIDSTIPLLKRNGDGVYPEHVWDLDAYLRARLGKGGLTFRKLEEAILGNQRVTVHYRRVEKLVQQIAPDEWGVDLTSPVENTGAGQHLHHGVLKIGAFLALGGREELVRELHKEGADLVVLACGLTGGTGGAALPLVGPVLTEAGYTVVPVGLLTHVPSIQVRGVVAEHVVTRVERMLKLVPRMIVFTGMQTDWHPKMGNAWSDLADMAVRLAELFSNVERLAQIHNTAPNMWMLGVNFRSDLLDRWMASILAQVGEVTAESARNIILKYFEAGWLKFGNPDTDNFCPVEVHNHHLLTLKHIQALLPSLLFVTHNEVVITGGRPRRFRKPEQFTLTLKGSPFVGKLLKKAGVRTVEELRLSDFVGLARYELWIIASAMNSTAQKALEYWRKNWITLARTYAAGALGSEGLYEPGEHLPVLDPDPPTRYYTWVQPGINQHVLAVRALNTLGRVLDPKARIELEAKRLSEQEALEREVQDRLGG
ncbi:MAG: hypothetical protein AAB443_02820 [Patescibacteria group bacterium]